jgi:hypothetical protein
MSKWLVEWSPPLGSIADEYTVRRRIPEAPWQDLVPVGRTRGTSILVDINDEGPTEFGIAPMLRGVEAPPERWTIVRTEQKAAAAVDIGPPDDVENFAVAQTGTDLVATWDQVKDPDLAGYEIRLGAWATGIVMAKIPPGANRWTFGAWFAGTHVYTIAAVNKAGIYSATPTAATAFTVRADDYSQLMATVDEVATGFLGTHTGTEIDGDGALRPTQFATAFTADNYDETNSANTPWWFPCIKDGNYITEWKDAGSVVHERVEVAPTGANVASAHDDRTSFFEPIWPEEDFDGNPRTRNAQRYGEFVHGAGLPVYGIGLRVEIDTSQVWAASSDGWRPWVPGATYKYRAVRLRFSFDVLWPFKFPRLTALAWSRWRLNKKDEGEIVIAGTGGTDITFATAFTAAPKLSGNLIHATNVGIVTFSNITTTGAKVRVYLADGTETETTGTIHWHALGV